MSQFEASDPLRNSTCKRAFLVTEKFALQQSGRDGRTIQLYKWFRTARAQVMNCARHQFLARAGFSVNQDRRACGSNGLDLVEDVAKGFAMPNNLFETALGSDFVFEIQLFLRELILKIRDLAISNRIFYGDCQLAGGLCKETDIAWREGVLASSEAHNAQNAVPVDQRQETAGLETLGQAR